MLCNALHTRDYDDCGCSLVDMGADDGVVEVVLAMVVVGIVVVGLGNSASPSASTKEL